MVNVFTLIPYADLGSPKELVPRYTGFDTSNLAPMGT